MKAGRKKILLFILTIFLAAVAYGLYTWFKPHRDVADEKGIQVTADALFNSFSENEKMADSLYLNKAIEVSGEVSKVTKNQTGETVVILKTTDPIFGINCTFKEDPGAVKEGSSITFKGICTGYLSDVVINQGIMVKK